MRLPGLSPQKRVVRTYGRDALLVLTNPLIAWVIASLGLRVGLRSDADVRLAMDKDARRMRERGYRIVSEEEFSLPVIGAPGRAASYLQVTYELDGKQRSELGREHVSD